MFYKITFQFKTPIVFIERPLFDGIFAFCYMRENYGEFDQKLNLTEEEIVDFFKVLPLGVVENEGIQYFNASWLLFDEESAIEQTDSYKKRFDFFNDDIIDFGGKTQKIVINKGDFKSYDIPFSTHYIKRGWFYFESNDVEQVQKLISKHLHGIGKKTSYGYGAIKTFHVEHIEYNPFSEIVLRPIPVSNPTTPHLQYCAFRPPYWLPRNFSLCKVK